jgi:hypothetical protein
MFGSIRAVRADRLNCASFSFQSMFARPSMKSPNRRCSVRCSFNGEKRRQFKRLNWCGCAHNWLDYERSSRLSKEEPSARKRLATGPCFGDGHDSQLASVQERPFAPARHCLFSSARSEALHLLSAHFSDSTSRCLFTISISCSLTISVHFRRRHRPLSHIETKSEHIEKLTQQLY